MGSGGIYESVAYGHFVALVLTFTNSQHSWVAQGYNDNGILRVLVQCGRSESNTLWMYEQSAPVSDPTNWSLPTIISSDYTNPLRFFGYDIFYC